MCTSSARYLRRHSQNDTMLQSEDRPSLRRRRSSCTPSYQPIEHDGPSLRQRRSMKEETMILSSCTSSHQPIKVSMAVICSHDKSRADDVNVFGSSTARAVLSIASISLLLLSLLARGFANGAHDIKHLSDTVMNLTRQYHSHREEDETSIQSLAALQHQLDEAKIELSWEKQHVEDQHEVQQHMFNEMLKALKKEEAVVENDRKVIIESAHMTHRVQMELALGQEENADLKRRLDLALKELASARSPLPAAPLPPSSSVERSIIGKSDVKNLRGAPASDYQPGDSIEIIQHEEGGKVSLHPGIIVDANLDGTYDLINLEEAVEIKGFKREQFQTYHVYQEGATALFEAERDFYLPVTIVGFIRDSALPGYEVHGSYRFTSDLDGNKIIHEGRANSIHRLAEVGEVVGAG